MIYTPNLIKGELHLIEKQFHLPFTKQYHKNFYPDKFIRMLERALKLKYAQYNVDITERYSEYVLNINEDSTRWTNLI